MPSRAVRAALIDWFVDRIELSRGTAGDNLRPMEGLRGFAVFLVFLVHYSTLIGPRITGHRYLPMLAEAMHTVGNRGVDLFFVLSGYLIYGSLMRRPQPFGPFMLRRVERIYPAFLVVLAIYVGLSFALPSERLIPAGWSAAALYLVANLLLLPGLFPIEPVLTVAWSLSYELFFYLAIPLIIALCSLRSRSATWRVVFFSMIAAAIAGFGLFQAGPVRLMMFVAGILLHETMRSRRLSPPGSMAASSFLIVALSATLIPTLGSTGYTLKTMLLFGAFFALCFSCFSMPSSRLARWFSATPLRWLGNMSYSYYLLHGLALKAAFAVLGQVIPTSAGGALWFWTLLPVMFAMTLIPTAALFLFVEHPLSLAPHRPLKAPNAVEAASTASASL